MDLGVVVLIIVAAWVGLFVVVLAMCRAASHADDQEFGAHQPIPTTTHSRLRPQLHGVRVHRG